MLRILVLVSLFLANANIAVAHWGEYAPAKGSCPSNFQFVRPADSLAPEEVSWLEKRHEKTNPALISFLKRLNLTGVDVENLVNGAENPINIALTFSGGGYRAMLAGAGELAAYDERTQSDHQGLRGLLQASTYLAGLSGGSWLVGTVTMNNFTSIDNILSSSSIWDLRASIFDPTGILNVLGQAIYYTGIFLAVQAKFLAGFEITLSDLWGRALSNQFLRDFPGDGAGLTFSSLAENLQTPFYNADQPLPLITALSRAPNTGSINFNSTVIEFTPFEIGSWDPSLSEFAKLKYVGTSLDNGKPTGSDCVTSLDNAGFVMGTSLSIFTGLFSLVNLLNLPPIIRTLIQKFVITPYTELNCVLASWTPNPFYKSSGGDFIHSQKNLYLADGGLDSQNVPLESLLQRNRNVDVIFAHDNSNNVDQWPNGKALVATYQRQFVPQGEGIAVPQTPNTNTFRNLNFTARPVFLGCEASNLTGLAHDATHVPLLVYIANRPFSYFSNTSTYKLSYSEDEKRGMIKNGYEIVSRKNGTIDDDWETCVGCAIIRREQERKGIPQTDQCKQCFSKYCWNGQEYSGPSRGDNFGDESLQISADKYNSNNVAGAGKWNPSLLKSIPKELEDY